MPSKSLASAGCSFFWVMFGQVLAYSVFRHLDRERQLAWLSELSRVLDDYGLLIAIVQGPEAARLGAVQDSLEART